MKRYFYIAKEFIIKNKKDILLFVIALLIIFLAFGLGYITGRDFSETPIIINKYSK
ncbi:MAG: hypothetical protein WC705_00245 [Candidatus Paceibacterota bacterium]|jgi:hypothetical protein